MSQNNLNSSRELRWEAEVSLERASVRVPLVKNNLRTTEAQFGVAGSEPSQVHTFGLPPALPRGERVLQRSLLAGLANHCCLCVRLTAGHGGEVAPAGGTDNARQYAGSYSTWDGSVCPGK